MFTTKNSEDPKLDAVRSAMTKLKVMGFSTHCIGELIMEDKFFIESEIVGDYEMGTVGLGMIILSAYKLQTVKTNGSSLI